MSKIIPDPFQRLKSTVLSGRKPHRPVSAARDHRIEQLESDVLFLSLLCRALIDVMTQKGTCDMEDVIEALHDVDRLDGKEDHGLPAKEVAEELGVEMPTRDPRKEFADRMQKD